VPEPHLGLTKVPAKEHWPAVQLGREIYQPEPRILELDPQLRQLTLIFVQFPREAEGALFELLATIVRIVGSRGGRHEVEFENRLTPAPMLGDDVLDDSPYQRQCPIGLLDREHPHPESYSGSARA